MRVNGIPLKNQHSIIPPVTLTGNRITIYMAPLLAFSFICLRTANCSGHWAWNGEHSMGMTQSLANLKPICSTRKGGCLLLLVLCGKVLRYRWWWGGGVHMLGQPSHAQPQLCLAIIITSLPVSAINIGSSWTQANSPLSSMHPQPKILSSHCDTHRKTGTQL